MSERACGRYEQLQSKPNPNPDPDPDPDPNPNLTLTLTRYEQLQSKLPAEMRRAGYYVLPTPNPNP